MFSDLTWRKRKQERDLRDRITSVDRFVDIGVVIHTVVADEHGKRLLRGKPKLRIVKSQEFGGILDTSANPPRITCPSANPVVWFCSEDQEPIILHGDSEPLGQLVYGSEGAGKTCALAMWHYFRWLEHLGERREGGQTAPTKARLKKIRDELFELYPQDWYRHRVAEDVIVLCDGTRIQLRSTKQQSPSSGSPIQGYNWSWCGRDEGQDQIERHEDIEARGRAAKSVQIASGETIVRYKQLVTATAKDSPDWRSFRDLIESAKTENGVALWQRRTLLGSNSPFVPAAFWAKLKATMSPREYSRRVLAQDVRPERTLYPTWERDRNLRPLIQVRAVDVTARELAPWGPNHHVLVGHDPGQLYDVSVLLKAYKLPGIADPVWWVVDEVTTELSTTEHHVKALRACLKDRWGCFQVDYKGRAVEGGPTALVRADPYGDTENDAEHPDRTVYTVFKQNGLQILAAAYASTPTQVKIGRVPREGRIDLVCTLFQAESKVTRLYVACDDRRVPAAPRLVKAIESSERDAAGRAEHGRKDKNDPTHWPAALGYALWAIEKPRLSGLSPSGSSRSVS